MFTLTYCPVLLRLPCSCLQSGFPVKTLYVFLVTPHPSHILSSSSSPTFFYSGLRNLLKHFHLRNIPKCLHSLGFLCPHMTLITFFKTFLVYGLRLYVEIIFHRRDLRSCGLLRSE